MSTDPFENFKKSKDTEKKLDRKNLPVENVGKVSNYFTVPKNINAKEKVAEEKVAEVKAPEKSACCR